MSGGDRIAPEGGQCMSVECGELIRAGPVAGSHELQKQATPQCPGAVPGLSEVSILLVEMCVVTGKRELGLVTKPVVLGSISPKKSWLCGFRRI